MIELLNANEVEARYGLDLDLARFLNFVDVFALEFHNSRREKDEHFNLRLLVKLLAAHALKTRLFTVDCQLRRIYLQDGPEVVKFSMNVIRDHYFKKCLEAQEWEEARR